MKRGEVYWIDVTEPVGGEIQKRPPPIIAPVGGNLPSTSGGDVSVRKEAWNAYFND